MKAPFKKKSNNKKKLTLFFIYLISFDLLYLKKKRKMKEKKNVEPINQIIRLSQYNIMYGRYKIINFIRNFYKHRFQY